uniref:ER membrane protein complex subunit 2 n=1 Tax=Blastobotrys adeninivorans TaxID=409370 RepID=A0A060TBZ7_BLAAD
MSTWEPLLSALHASKYLTYQPKEINDLYTLSKSFQESPGSVDEGTQYDLLRLHFHLALITGDDVAAKTALQRLRDRFGDESSNIGILVGQFLELTKGLKEAQDYLSSRPATDYGAFKRKTVILKRTGNIPKFIEELLRYVGVCPTDYEAWAELAEAYYSIKHYARAMYCVEEVLVLCPQAYNMFARAGEITHVGATVASNVNDQIGELKVAAQHFCRAVELSPNYIRGWCGVHVVCSKIVSFPKLSPQDSSKYQKLGDLAKSRLQEIYDSKAAPDKELEAAKLVLAK